MRFIIKKRNPSCVSGIECAHEVNGKSYNSIVHHYYYYFAGNFITAEEKSFSIFFHFHRSHREQSVRQLVGQRLQCWTVNENKSKQHISCHVKTPSNNVLVTICVVFIATHVDDIHICTAQHTHTQTPPIIISLVLMELCCVQQLIFNEANKAAKNVFCAMDASCSLLCNEQLEIFYYVHTTMDPMAQRASYGMSGECDWGGEGEREGERFIISFLSTMIFVHNKQKNGREKRKSFSHFSFSFPIHLCTIFYCRQ